MKTPGIGGGHIALSEPSGSEIGSVYNKNSGDSVIIKPSRRPNNKPENYIPP